ncbi:PLP-dependent lyase/thiolase [Candidatus Micrarchaeota archaeon]|nr:PLP-dependent lyase/thiolase [Candidatus Micrarchaeota archaeon]
MSLTQKEEKILKSIVVPSENNPHAPEFPPGNPKFPATATYKIEVPGFSDVWLKDESINPTGTHKDRMAWEIIVTYKQFLLAKKQGIIPRLPELSILSSGSAALAIQSQLRKYGLPNLRVLIDANTKPKITNYLKKIGCMIFKRNLGKKLLNWEDILRLTENSDGFDITSNEAYDPTIRFYDWMSYEIINSNAEFVFIPFGTGQLYENIMNIVKRELTYKFKDPRFKGRKNDLRKCSFLGATTFDPKSKADKLYAPFLPFANYSKQWIKYYIYTNTAGKMSSVYSVKEKYLDKAIRVAEDNGINCEPSGIAGLALMLQMKNSLPKNKKMLIVNTGKTKFPDQKWEKS